MRHRSLRSGGRRDLGCLSIWAVLYWGAMQADGFWFKSSKFEIEPGEDKEINPGVYGRQLAVWLAGQLRGLGYDVELINEDLGAMHHVRAGTGMAVGGLRERGVGLSGRAGGAAEKRGDRLALFCDL